MVRTITILFVGIVSISFAAIFIRFCDDVPAIMIATYRLCIASSILLVFSGIKGVSFKTVCRRDLLLSLAGGVFLGLHFIFWTTSLKYTSVASSVVIVTTNPIFVGIFSWFFLKEKQYREIIAGTILCLLGSIVIAAGDSGLHALILLDKRALTGDLLALMGAVMGSAYLLTGSRVRERLGILTYITIVFTMSALFLLATALVTDVSFTGYRSSSYMYIILLAVIPQLVGHTSINWALEHLRAGMIAISILGEAIGATILAYLFFGETVSTFQVAGMVLIFTAIIIASRKGKKHMRDRVCPGNRGIKESM
ncbi:MAG: DMT family transporter [Syntrophobacterales bacterium]|nr:DMT family transporter [Syntrophobacterales bacterium]